LREIGLFCGTFNPVHYGHLLIAECARSQFKLEKVLFVTSPRPPHRDDVYLDGMARHNMVAAAVQDNSMFEAATIEIERPGASYTIDTINYVRGLFGPDLRLNLLIGGDNVSQLKTWHKIEDIYRSCRLLVARRTIDLQNKNNESTRGLSSDLQAIEVDGAKYEVIDFPLVDISSSMIRSRLAAGKSVLYMVPLAVNEILQSRGYYSNGPSS
jgi:nicotinate-nucleotide adenylyltransferase